MFDRIKRNFKSKESIVLMLMAHGFFNRMSDEKYLRLKYKMIFGKELNLNNPQTFSEKVQWLKLYDRRPEYTIMVDKYAVKAYVEKLIGKKYIIPTIGVWDNPDDIDFSTLPDRFVLKCNHNSGLGMFICKDKKTIDEKKVRADLAAGLKENFFLRGREWPYKNVPHKIIAEKYMEDRVTGELRDYKFFCFNGEVKALFIASDRQSEDEETKFDFFDADYNHLPFTNGHPNASITPQKPICFEEMKRLASILSKGIPQVRVDFYEVDGQVYFGELTLSHWSGMTPFKPDKWDLVFGKWITLPEKRV